MGLSPRPLGSDVTSRMGGQDGAELGDTERVARSLAHPVVTGSVSVKCSESSEGDTQAGKPGVVLNGVQNFLPEKRLINQHPRSSVVSK